jgi:hypothetical protein
VGAAERSARKKKGRGSRGHFPRMRGLDQRGRLKWRGTCAKVVNVYLFRDIAGVNIFATVRMISGEWSSVIMVIS